MPPDARHREHGGEPAGWSLEHRLPVLIFVLLACVVGGLSLAAYREVRATAVVRATDRLERVGRELLSCAAKHDHRPRRLAARRRRR